ncbi:MAG TPA: T9SS type B sorting domain-containing protein [Flavobacterium sp.]
MMLLCTATNYCIGAGSDSVINYRSLVANEPPVLFAAGSPIHCPGTASFIVSDFTIADPDDSTTDAVYIQISSGYAASSDLLSLTVIYPNIIAQWNASTGKLTLKHPSGAQVPYADFIEAVKDVVYTSSSATPTGTRTFSITVGQANYLPSTGHYYRFVSSLGITWTNAKTAAEQSTYFGLQGYLATIGATDEAQLAGEQASGAGWIGGSDEAVEGVWRWMTGPENGTIFWNGGVNGSTPNFAFWNTSEPNNLGDENYAHITAASVGIPGSWNDLPNAGSSGDYEPKGYIVEYGGMPGDPTLNISASTTLYHPVITNSISATRCDSGTVTLFATSNIGEVHWYDTQDGGTLLHIGNQYATPTLAATTTYYVDPYDTHCPGGTRTAIVATVSQRPVVTVTPPAPSCEGSVTIEATSTAGIIRWFATSTGGSELGTGTNFTTPVLTVNTTYYIEANNNGCVSATRTPVTVQIYSKPNVGDEEVAVCEDSTVILDAGVSNATYLWSPSGATSRTISVDSPGTYTVAVTSPAPQSCTSVKTITVVEKVAPHISEVIVNDNIVTIVTTNSGEFTYSIDGANFQQSNIFEVNEPGLGTAYVREINDCGFDDADFIILQIPQFFSPNSDDYNDHWTVRGISFYPEAKIAIFDRYGKLIVELNSRNWYWDGNLNGTLLPASDYWYLLQINDSLPTRRGHFSLVR